jgi:hypothetical protein
LQPASAKTPIIPHPGKDAVVNLPANQVIAQTAADELTIHAAIHDVGTVTAPQGIAAAVDLKK